MTDKPTAAELAEWRRLYSGPRGKIKDTLAWVAWAHEMQETMPRLLDEVAELQKDVVHMETCLTNAEGSYGEKREVWDAEIKRLEAERDEARAEIERLQKDAQLASGVVRHYWNRLERLQAERDEARAALETIDGQTAFSAPQFFPDNLRLIHSIARKALEAK